MQVVIVAHVSRAAMLDRLTDRFPDAIVFLDDGTLGGWRNHRRALSWAAEYAEGAVLVLEDDAVPADDLEESACALVERHPGRLISLYAGTSYPAWVQPHYLALMGEADILGRAWFELPALCHAVGYIMPTLGLADLLVEADKGKIGTDERLSRSWSVMAGTDVVYAHPSLVDHADEEPVEQHLDGLPRDRPRRAHAFQGRP